MQPVHEAHQRNMKVILDGVFNHCGSFNKWMDREKFYANSHNYPVGHMVQKAVRIIRFFTFTTNKHGRIIPITMDGGDMIHFLSLTMKDRQNSINM